MGIRAGLEVFAAPTSSLILACGDSRYSAIGNIIRMVLMFAGVWYAFGNFGIHEAVTVLALIPGVSYPVLIFGIARHLRGALWFEIMGFGIFSAVTAIAAALTWL